MRQVWSWVLQNKYQAALQRLRSDPTWLGMDPTKRQEAFESLWGQYSIKQWQAWPHVSFLQSWIVLLTLGLRLPSHTGPHHRSRRLNSNLFTMLLSVRSTANLTCRDKRCDAICTGAHSIGHARASPGARGVPQVGGHGHPATCRCRDGSRIAGAPVETMSCCLPNWHPHPAHHPLPPIVLSLHLSSWRVKDVHSYCKSWLMCGHAMVQAQLAVALEESGEEANGRPADAGGGREGSEVPGSAAEARKDLVKAKLAVELVQAEARTAAQACCLTFCLLCAPMVDGVAHHGPKPSQSDGAPASQYASTAHRTTVASLPV